MKEMFTCPIITFVLLRKVFTWIPRTKTQDKKTVPLRRRDRMNEGKICTVIFRLKRRYLNHASCSASFSFPSAVSFHSTWHDDKFFLKTITVGCKLFRWLYIMWYLAMCVCVCVYSLGVWGSAFSILFNRVLGVKDIPGGSTMEEELGMYDVYSSRPLSRFTQLFPPPEQNFR